MAAIVTKLKGEAYAFTLSFVPSVNVCARSTEGGGVAAFHILVKSGKLPPSGLFCQPLKARNDALP